jgi:PTH1 family peptidyl-tRNA hydrolase
MSDSRFRIIAGLGNPGRKYFYTRHNAGFLMVDRLASEFGFSLSKAKYDGVYGTGSIRNIPVILVKPHSFMNRSGPPVKQLSDYYGIKSEDVLVIHDDIDLALGRIKIKEKGGDGGHKGLRSLIDAFSSGDFPRLRIGIGRPGPGIEITDYVLGKFSMEENNVFDDILKLAGDAVLTILTKGVKEGMNQFNNRHLVVSC